MDRAQAAVAVASPTGIVLRRPATVRRYWCDCWSAADRRAYFRRSAAADWGLARHWTQNRWPERNDLVELVGRCWPWWSVWGSDDRWWPRESMAKRDAVSRKTKTEYCLCNYNPGSAAYLIVRAIRSMNRRWPHKSAVQHWIVQKNCVVLIKNTLLNKFSQSSLF